MPPCHAVQVPFDKPMLPSGNVEVWLAEVERRMKSSVRTQVCMCCCADTPGPIGPLL
jgi:dynein heavy chain